jgi:DNA-binding NarL/FixJ family response regulator
MDQDTLDDIATSLRRIADALEASEARKVRWFAAKAKSKSPKPPHPRNAIMVEMATLGYTQTQIADRLHITQPMVSKILKAARELG